MKSAVQQTCRHQLRPRHLNLCGLQENKLANPHQGATSTDRRRLAYPGGKSFSAASARQISCAYLAAKILRTLLVHLQICPPLEL